MSEAPVKRADSPDRFRQLERSLSALNPEGPVDDLVRQVVETIAAQRGLAGARLWKLEGNAAHIWGESGTLPAADADAVQNLAAGQSAAETNGVDFTWVLGRGSVLVSVLEAHAAAPPDDETRSLLEVIRRYAEVALISSERRHSVVELSTIVEATKRLNSTLDLGELINIILQLATRQTVADRGTVFLYDRERDEIWSMVGMGLEQHEIRLPATKGIAGWVAKHGETVNLPDAYQDPRFERDVDRRLGYRTRSLLCLPICNKDGENIGVLQLLNKQGGAFTSGDESFLRSLSDHVALALENAQLHRERLAKQRMERDLSLARSIQIGLLPDKPPQLAGFDFAVSHKMSLEAGGDYYDFIPLGPETLLTVIADVEGKGVGSAMVMANLQATLHALLAHLHSLERLVSSLNDMMLSDTRGQKFMTMFLFLLDQRHRVLHYVNAGHVPPAVVREDGTVEYLREGGMVVGLFAGVPFERGHIRLRPGDIFVGCTDGITEAMDVDSNEFGSERLAKAVQRLRDEPAEQIVDSVLAEVDKFSKDGPHEDDRVILILKVL